MIEDKLSLVMRPDPETGMNLIDAIAERFGKGFRMSLLAKKSGEARHTKMIEKRVFEAAKNKIPELKLGLKVLDQLGLGDLAEDPENLPALMTLAQKYGLLGGAINMNPSTKDVGSKW